MNDYLMALNYDSEIPVAIQSANYEIVVPLPTGNYLVATRNGDPHYDTEIFMGLVDKRGCWFQDLACVRNAYQYMDEMPTLKKGKMEVLVYADDFDEDYTHKFTIDEREDDEQ